MKPPALRNGKISRRFFLAEGARLITYGSLGGLAAAMAWPGRAHGQDWGALFRSRPTGGHGTVKDLRGQASAAGRPLAAGARVASGEQIRVGPNSRLILSLSDHTILRINAGTVVSLEVGVSRTGFFRLLVGSLLTVLPTGNRYLVHLPTATVGIKGTIFFQQIYAPGETVAVDRDQGRVTIPEGIGEYFCLCNGLADFMGKLETTPFFSDDSYYHNSYYIDPRLPNPMVPAPQLNHTDEQIRDLIRRQDGPKHNTAFLDNYRY